MKPMMYIAASVLVLGIAGAGLSYGAEPYSSSTASPQPGSSFQTPSSATASANASEDQITAAQEQLKAAGLYTGGVDGIMGPLTKQAIQQFQQQHGLQVTGALDQQTMAALQNNSGRAGSTAAPSAGQPPAVGGPNTTGNNRPQR
jgi:peptidoglycan hydrolase-like protein with peptidoglycan-binding domain